jgi:hypothetical protein
MADYYPNFFHTTKQKPLAYPKEYNLLSRSDHRFEDDKYK